MHWHWRVYVLQVSLGRILKAVIAFKGLMIEWVVVKGHGETLDLWTESRHKVFRKVTENAHAAMLHFSSPTLPELAVRSFMVRSLCFGVSVANCSRSGCCGPAVTRPYPQDLPVYFSIVLNSPLSADFSVSSLRLQILLPLFPFLWDLFYSVVWFPNHVEPIYSLSLISATIKVVEKYVWMCTVFS